jgi:hypothetical protein
VAVNAESTSDVSVTVRLLYRPGILATSESAASVDFQLIQADRFHPFPTVVSASSAEVVIRLIIGVGGGNSASPEVIVVANVTTIVTLSKPKPTIVTRGKKPVLVTLK